jgi:hypothetical protein
MASGASDGLWVRTGWFLWVLLGTWGLVEWSGVIWGAVSGVYRCLGSSEDAWDGPNRGFKLQNGRKWPLGAHWPASMGIAGYLGVSGG